MADRLQVCTGSAASERVCEPRAQFLQHPFWSPAPTPHRLPPRLHFVKNFARDAAVTTSGKRGPAWAPSRDASGQESAAGPGRPRVAGWRASARRREASGREGGRARDGGRGASAGAGRARGTYRSGGGSGSGGSGGPGGGGGCGRLLVFVARRWRPYLAAGSGQQSER